MVTMNDEQFSQLMDKLDSIDNSLKDLNTHFETLHGEIPSTAGIEINIDDLTDEVKKLKSALKSGK